ncbi:MAG: tripartite tricarboxylate transporter permease [Candidatus Rokubacteria bacterium]|nr:tripartite tricarboxylate transporter permease [Candidatus Rokubacteria bacterium]
MDLLVPLAHGFVAALSPANVLWCLLGVVLGTLIGVLPGIGPITTIAMLLPLTYALGPLTALIMLAGIYYGAQYGGSTTSILINLPGEATSVVTCIDGHQMALRGRAGAALAIAAIGSFFAGCVGTLAIALFGPTLAGFAQRFSAPEYFALMVLGLICAVVLSHGSFVKAVGMILVGLLLGLVGIDVNSGTLRYTFDFPQLSDGVGFVPLAMGVFGIAEIALNLQRAQDRSVLGTTLGRLWLTRDETRLAAPAVARGTLLGAVLGLMPGGGAILGSFGSYTLEKKLARDPSRFGRGAIEGVAGPEAANNAAAQTAFIPLLTLGIPSNAVMALMMGAMIIHGITPGTAVMSQRPDLFWGMVASMWIGNLMLLVINLPLVGVWVRLLRIPYRLLFPSILVFICIGAYSLNNNVFDIGLAILFGVFGFVLAQVGCEPAPLLLGFVLGPPLEENLRRAMLMSHGDPTILVARPISAALLATAVALVLVLAVPAIRRRREETFAEGD